MCKKYAKVRRVCQSAKHWNPFLKRVGRDGCKSLFKSKSKFKSLSLSVLTRSKMEEKANEKQNEESKN